MNNKKILKSKMTRKFMFGVAALAVFAMMFTPAELASAQADENKIESSRILQKYEEYHLEADKPRLTIESIVPRDGVPIPENAIATHDGGYVTPLRLVNDEGKPLNMKYEYGIESLTNEKNPPACRGPSTGLYQEGGSWTTTSNSQTIGYSELWQMSTGTITGSNAGIYYNPVNFNYPATGTNYDFFQVDWGIGNNVVSNWIMTYSYVDGNGVRQYPYTAMPAVSVSPGSYYRVDASLQAYPLANPSSYVVQITQGSNSWLYSKSLGYTPASGSVNNFDSFQDQWLKNTGSSTLSPDRNLSPKVLKNVGGTVVSDSTLVTNYSTFDLLNTSASGTTSDILSPTNLATKSWKDSRECSTW